MMNDLMCKCVISLLCICKDSFHSVGCIDSGEINGTTQLLDKGKIYLREVTEIHTILCRHQIWMTVASGSYS